MFKLIKYLKGYRVQSIIDVGVKNQDKGYIYKMGLVLVILGILGLAAAITAQYFAAKASVGFGTALRRDFYKHLNSLSHKEIDKIGTATKITRNTNDINQEQTGVNMI